MPTKATEIARNRELEFLRKFTIEVETEKSVSNTPSADQVVVVDEKKMLTG